MALDRRRRSIMEQIVRGLCLGILLVAGLMSLIALLDRSGLGGSADGLMAAALQFLMLGWMWLYRSGREGMRWQFGCGYVGFATIAFNMYAMAFLGGASGPLWLIGGAGIVYGLVPMVRRARDEELEGLSITQPSPYAVDPRTGRDAFDLRMQVQALAVVILIGWALLVGTRLEEFAGFLGRVEGTVMAAFLWMMIGGFWWFSMGRRGVTAKSLAASIACALMATNLFSAAFHGGGWWLITLVALLVNLVALFQSLPNRGMEALPRSPRVGEWPRPFEPAEAHAGQGRH